MSDQTFFPALEPFQWERPGAENPRLKVRINATQTIFIVTNPPLDKNGKIMASRFLMGSTNGKGYTETIEVPAEAVQGFGNTPDSTNLGTTIGTGAKPVVRGVGLSGLDIDTEVSGLAAIHEADSKVFCNISAMYWQLMQSTLRGAIGTGAANFYLGNNTNQNYAYGYFDSTSLKGLVRINTSTGKAQFSNDGSVWVNMDNSGVGTITWADGLNGGSGSANPFVELANTPAFLTGDTGAQGTPATWEAVTDGSFAITIDGTAYDIDAIDFTSDASMDNVAATLQTAVRTATGNNETVVWDTDHFIISSVNFRSGTSAITVTSTSGGTVGTDISGAGGTDWMDADAGNGTVTNLVELSGLTMINGRLSLSKGVIQNSSWTYDEDAEASDAYVITVSPVPDSLVAGQEFDFLANTANTGASSLNVNDLGAVALKKFTDQDTETGDIEANSILKVKYDGANFQILSATAAQLTTAEITTLTGGGNADALHTHASSSKRLNTTVADVVITNSVTLQDFISFPLPANSLGTNKVVHGRLYFDTFSLSSSNVCEIRLKYGGTQILNVWITNNSGGILALGGGYIDFTIMGSGATNTQDASLVFTSGTGTAVDAGIDNGLIIGMDQGQGSKDSTGTLTLAISAQMGNPSGSDTITFRNGYVELITD